MEKIRIHVKSTTEVKEKVDAFKSLFGVNPIAKIKGNFDLKKARYGNSTIMTSYNDLIVLVSNLNNRKYFITVKWDNDPRSKWFEVKPAYSTTRKEWPRLILIHP